MDKIENKNHYQLIKVTNINIRKTEADERMRVENNLEKTVKTLTELKLEIDKAAKINPCPGCKHDTEQLAKFISAKLDSVRSGSDMSSNTIGYLKEVDYINELTGIAITFSKFIKPFTRVSKVPEVYEKVINEDMEANKKVKEHLLKALELNKELENNMQLKTVSEVLKAFIRATEFKLSVDPYTFYLFDRIIRLGYKTHILSTTGKVIVGIKGMVDPLRYK